MSITIAKAVGLNASNLFNDVIKIQWLLNHFRGLGRFHGPAVTIDGDCGPKTRTAITAFQIQNGLLSEEHFYGQIRPHGSLWPMRADYGPAVTLEDCWVVEIK